MDAFTSPRKYIIDMSPTPILKMTRIACFRNPGSINRVSWKRYSSFSKFSSASGVQLRDSTSCLIISICEYAILKFISE